MNHCPISMLAKAIVVRPLALHGVPIWNSDHELAVIEQFGSYIAERFRIVLGYFHQVLLELPEHQLVDILAGGLTFRNAL